MFAGIRTLLTGAERVSSTHVRRVLELFPDMHVVNGYGPAESTIFATSHVIRAQDVAQGSTEVPIGKPVPCTTVAILSDDRPAARGELGEIVIAGDGLALGYLGDDEETDRRFFEATDGRIAPGRYYRTGDLAVLDEEGNLRFRGRVDRQIKIRGIRIEPGEIESVLATHPAVSSCHVLRVERSAGRGELACVYASTDDRPVDETKLRRLAAERLLPAMVPSIIHHVLALPLLPNGKIDEPAVRDALAGRCDDEPSAGAVCVASADPLLLEVQEILGLCVAAGQDLLDAGATSLDAVRLAARLSVRLKARVTIADIYRLRTFDAICAACRSAEQTVAVAAGAQT
ncbi:MAG: hypothetical protein QOJ63_3729, partial [Solirubrobacteraceae bacterium]|nr:hypothetical protein [Solirubrobacteraceae bacterium]